MEVIANEEFIRSALGDNVEPLSLTINNELWYGWARSYQDDDWKLIPQVWRYFHQRNIRFFNTQCFELDCNALLAIPNLPVFEIVKYSCMGAGIFGDEKTPTQIQNVLATIWEQCPFEIVWIDPVALKGFFTKDLTDAQAQEIEEVIEQSAPGSNGHFCDEWIQEYEEQVSDPTLGDRLFEAILQLHEGKIEELPDGLPEVPDCWKLLQKRQEFRVSFDPW